MPRLYRCRTGLLASALVAVLLSGCSTTPTDDAGPGPDSTPSLSEIEQLLDQAQSSEPLLKAEYTLQAAEGLFAEGQLPRAKDLLQTINPMMLSTAREQRYWLLKAQVASSDNQPEQSLQWLARINQPDLLSEDFQQRWLELERRNLSQMGDSSGMLDTLIEQSDGLYAEAQTGNTTAVEQLQQLHNRIWVLLQTLPRQQLQQQLNDSTNSFSQSGWYALTQSLSGDALDLLQRGQKVKNWQQQWAAHPAVAYMPTELQVVTEQYGAMPKHVAVLLPQSGPLAKPAQAILEGMLAAHYQHQQRGYPTPRLSFYDSTQVGDLDFFYQLAQYQGIDFIIGPLAKAHVGLLNQQQSVSIPTLALNYSDEQYNAAQLYQFGLRGEDEARQVALRAWQDGHRKAVSLTPTTSWGERIQQAFAERWQQLGGQLVAQQQFTGENDYSAKISNMLAVDSSNERMKALRSISGESIEFESRRRQDVDFIFLSALPQAARQIKPTLAFYYAADLPVYATSHIYSGDNAQTRDQDLNGILFTSIPWTLNPQHPLKSSLSIYRDDTHSRFGRLYALGADAYRLAPYVQQLQNAGNNYIQGETGRLSVTRDGLVTRKLDWARFSDGLVEPLQPGNEQSNLP